MLRCVYFDLDGTIVGRGGSLLHDESGNVSLLGARALEAAHRAGVELVAVSGRKRETVREPARAFGCSAYAFEVGGGLVVDGEDFWQTGELQPTATQTVHEQISARGVVELLTSNFAGRLEPHIPWHLGREVSWLMRGEVDVAEAQRLLDAHGSSDLRLVDNGFVGGLRVGGTGFDDRLQGSELDPSIEYPRSYHLTPRETSKAAAVARHRQIRGYEREETISVGDSAEDIGMAAETGVFWLIAAGHGDPRVDEVAARHDNVRRCEGGPGDGVYEAVVTTLMVGDEQR